MRILRLGGAGLMMIWFWLLRWRVGGRGCGFRGFGGLGGWGGLFEERLGAESTGIRTGAGAAHNCFVRVKTSIMLPGELLASIDRADSNRSSFIEKACRAYLARLEKAGLDATDAKIIDRNADRLNGEAM